jgi:hypothetical protein
VPRLSLHLIRAALVSACILPVAVCQTGPAGGAQAHPAAAARSSPPRPGALLFSDDFSRPNGPNHLVVNEWSHWNPDDSARVISSAWQMTSGSLFSVGGIGWTGVPDDTPPDRYSHQHTDSQVFRLNTARGDFGDVVQELDARISGFTGSANFPAVDWDGVVLWPRYVTEFHLYFAYLLRKDGRVAITKKCPGHVPGGSFYNGGSYFDLASERYLGPTVVGRWYRLASSAQDNPDGSVTIRTFQDGRLVAQATDHGLGCPPIGGPTQLGIRSDNVDANLTHYRVYELSSLLPRSCPDSLVGAPRRTELAHARRRSRAHGSRCPAAFAPAGR